MVPTFLAYYIPENLKIIVYTLIKTLRGNLKGLKLFTKLQTKYYSLDQIKSNQM